jgi:SAM-dependent methyltransferase
MGHFSKELAPDSWQYVIDEYNRRGIVGETSKSHERRVKEGWHEKYAPANLSGLDIGCGEDALNNTFRRWDKKFKDGDAQEMEGVPDNTFHTVYASHILEHIRFPSKAVKKWYDIVEPGGHLIMCVPHRDLYEKKRVLPSNWNNDHKHFFLPEDEEQPCTLSFKKVILSVLPDADFAEFRVLDEGFLDKGKDWHSAGEYSIEAVIRKPS